MHHCIVYTVCMYVCMYIYISNSGSFPTLSKTAVWKPLLKQYTMDPKILNQTNLSHFPKLLERILLLQVQPSDQLQAKNLLTQLIKLVLHIIIPFSSFSLLSN